jgi:polyhydroxybutyrate depolymerase
MRRRGLLAATGVLAASGCLVHPNRPVADDATEQTIEHGGRTRQYRLVTPDGDGPFPTILVLHGGGGTPERIARTTGFDGRGREAGFAVVYPAGVGNNWNDGRESVTSTHRQNVDDVGFLAALIERLVSRGVADPSAVASTGLSNGAFMTHRLLVERPEPLAAAVTFAGSLAVGTEVSPAKAVPVAFIHGTADPLVPYEGGGVGFSGNRGTVLGAEQFVDQFVAAYDCDPTPVVTTTDSRRDGTRLERRRYRNGAAPVDHSVIHGGGHGWPGRPDGLLDLVFGPRSRELDGTDAVIEFVRGVALD